MKITLVAVGKIKESWLKEGISEYITRIRKFSEITIQEIPDSPDEQGIEKCIADESEKILSRIDNNDFVVALDVSGVAPDSVELSRRLMNWMEVGGSKITIVIGGSNGFTTEVADRANAKISLSRLTFPHRLVRLIILEQLYRAFKISRNEKYHK